MQGAFTTTKLFKSDIVAVFYNYILAVKSIFFLKKYYNFDANMKCFKTHNDYIELILLHLYEKTINDVFRLQYHYDGSVFISATPIL